MMLSRAFFFPIILYLAPSRRVVSAQGVDDLIRWVVTFNEGILSDKVTDILAVAGISIPEISLSIPELFIEVFMMERPLPTSCQASSCALRRTRHSGQEYYHARRKE